MKKKILLSMLMILFLGISSFAQTLGDYTFSTGTDEDKWITLSTTTSIISPGAGDNGKSSVMDIGFPFTFGDEIYTQFSVNADGNLRLGSIQTGTSGYTNPFSTSYAGTNSPKINMLGCDGYISDSGFVYHQVVGSEPERICVIEFATSTFNSTSRASLLRWQVQLFEGSNDIQIVYSSTQPPILPAVTRQVGMCVDASDILLVNANHQMTHYTAGQSTTIASGTWPDVNRYYLFTAPVISCPKVAEILAGNVTSTTADLSWTPVGSESMWDLYITTTATDVPGASSTPTEVVYNTPEYALTDLNSNTTYYIYVRANCDNDDVSLWKSYTLTTPCDPINTLPLVFNLDNYTGTTSTTASTSNLPSCWNHINEGTNTSYSGYPIIYNSSTHAASGTNSLRFYTYTTAGTYDDQYAILPPIDVDVNPLNTLQVSFDAKALATNYTFVLVVGVISNASDRNSFEAMDTIYINSTSYGNHSYEVSFARYTGTGNRIAFKAPMPQSGYNEGNVDNIVIDLIPACSRPVHLAAAPSLNSAVLTWESTGSLFDLYYKNVFDTEYDVISGVSLTNGEYLLTGLENTTTYNWYVQTSCGLDEELASEVATFHTDMLPVELPYTANFGEDGWLLNNGTCNNYWAQGAVGNDSYGLFVTNNGTTPGYTVTTKSAVSAEKYLTVGDAENVTVSFDLQCGGEGNFDFLKVFLAPVSESYEPASNDPAYADKAYTTYAADFADYMSMTTAPSAAQPYTYKICLTGGNTLHIELSMANPIEDADASSEAKLVFVWRNDGSGGTQPGAIITNLHLEATSCFAPSLPVAENVTPYSADITWVAPETGSGNYVLQYAVNNTDWNDESVVTINVNDTVASLTDLSPATTYQIRVATDCGDELSIWKPAFFTTECAGLTSLPYFCDFETVSTATNPLPFCWTKGSQNTTYPYSYSIASAYAGSRILYFYTANYVCMPPVDPESIDLTATQVSFYAKGSSANYVLQVGVMTDPTDASTFEQITSFTLTNAYEYYEVSLAGYEGSGTYVALRNIANNYIYVDNFTLGELPECPRPQNLEANTMIYSATLTWESEETEFTLYYKESTASDYIAVPYVTSPYELTGLVANTNYDWFVVVDCGGDTMPSFVSTFTTACAEITMLPFFEDFDDMPAGAAPACWPRGAYHASYPQVYVSSGNAHSGTQAVYYYYSNTLALPLVNPNAIDLSEAQLSFWAKANAGNTVDVGFYTNPLDSTTFTRLATISPTTDNVLYTVSLSSHTPEMGNYVGFRRTGSTGGLLFIDDVTLEDIPLCERPELTPAIVTADNVTLTWSSESSSFNLYYRTTADSLYEEITGITDTFYILSDLLPVTEYVWYVAGLCDDGSLANSFLGDFTTPMIPTELPYTADFSDEDTWILNNGTCINQWVKGAINDTLNGLFVSNNGSTPGYTTSSAAGAVSAEKHFVVGDAGSVVVSFDLNCGGESTYDYLKVFLAPMSESYPAGSSPSWAANSYSTYAADFSDYLSLTGNTTQPYKINLTQGNTIHVEVFLSNPNIIADAGSMAKLVMVWRNDGSGGTQPGAIVTNLEVFTLDCDIPTIPVVSNIQATSAEVAWNATTSSFVIQYGLANLSWDSDDIITEQLSDNNTILTGLEPNTQYHLRVASLCGSDTSAWRTVLFTTECAGLVSLPYFCDFENVPSGSYQIPACWTKGGMNSTYPYSYSSATNAYDGTRLLYFYTPNYICLPPVDASVVNLTDAQVSFYAKGNGYQLAVGIMSDPSDFSTFEPIDTLTFTATYAYYEVPFDNYTGTGTYVTFKNITTNYIYVDNLILDYVAACDAPEDIVASNPSQTSVNLSWTGDALYYNVYYKEANASDYTQVSYVSLDYDGIYTLSGLQPGTVYQWYVSAICPDNSESSSHESGTFTTLCDAIDLLPVTWDFETYEESTQLPTCWSVLHPTNDGPKIMTSYAHNGSHSLRLYDNSPITTVILPAVDNNLYPVNNLRVKFYGINMGTYPAWDVCVVGGVITDPMNDSSFVFTDSIHVVGAAGGSHVEYTLDMSSFSGTEGQVALQFYTVNGARWLNIDDLTLEVIEDTTTVIEPTVVTGNASGVTQTTATLNGTINNPDNVTITAKGFEWKATVGGTYTSVTVSGNNFTYNLTGLTPGTGYTYKAFITYNGNTVYGDEVTFTTTQPVTPTDPTVTTAAASNITQTTATLNGSITNPDNVTITAKGFEWKTTVGGTYAPVTVTGNNLTYNLTNLVPNTGYTYKAFITFNGTTVYGSEMTFTTLPEDTPEPCDVPTNLHTTDIQNEAIAIAWDANANVSSWNIRYSTVGGTWNTATSNTNSYTITGLTGLTDYEIQVQANCGNGNLSEWSGSITAQTTNVGIEEHLLNSISLYPNPANDVVNVECTMNNVQLEGIEVIDVYGKVVRTVVGANNYSPIRINVSGLANGMYFVRVTTDEGVVTKTFIKK